MSNTMTRTGLTANVTLYSEQSTESESQYFRIGDKPVTISAVNLAEDDVITFYVVKVSAKAKLTSECDCTFAIPQPAILGEQLLMCPECVDEIGFVPVRLTANNPIVVLKHPHGSVVRANYEGQGLGESTVWFVTGAIDANITPGMSGCPQVCCEDISWTDTGNFRCNILTNQKEQQQISNCGRSQWLAQGPLNWQDTGDIRCNVIAGTKERKQVNECGDIRWTADGAIVWTDTGLIRCDLANNIQSHQEVNDCGGIRWVADSIIIWTPTGETRCRNHVLQNEQVNACGNTRWVDTDNYCEGGDDDELSYIASYPLPGGDGWAYRPGDPRDPAATVELEDCDGEGLSLWLYPAPNTFPLATIPVYNCIGANCPSGSTPLGYARNVGPQGATQTTTAVNVNVVNVKPYLVYVYRTPEYKIQVWSNGDEVRFFDPQYCASLPIEDGFGYRRGDLRDPEATLVSKTPDGVMFNMYPTPRVNATIPYLNGYLCNFSNCYGAGANGGNSGLQFNNVYGRTVES